MKIVHKHQRTFTPWDEIGVGEVFRSPKNVYQRIEPACNANGNECEAFCFDTGELVRGGRGKGKNQYQIVTDRAKLVVGNPKKAS